MALEDLGLTFDEETVYRALIARPVTTTAQVAEATGTVVTDVAAALETLAARGLVSRQSPVGHYAAVPPAIALGAELAGHRDRLQRAELAVAELVETYRTGSMGRAQRDLVDVVEGPEAVQQRYVQLKLAARSRIDLFATGGIRGAGPGNSQEATVLARSVRVRGVIDHRFLREPRATDDVDQSVAAGVLVRVVGEIPLKLIVCDGEVAMLPLYGRAGEVDPSLVLRGRPARVAQALFEAVWNHARPYGRAHHGLDMLDTHILRLLLTGLTDTAVAGQLDLSARTVQRRVQALMAQAGVTTRIQLGWHASHHGWA